MLDGGEFEARRQLVQMQMLYEVGLALNESLDPTHVVQEILQRALTMVDARAGALLVPRAGGEELDVVAEIGLGDHREQVLDLPGVGQAWSTGRAVAVDRDMEIGQHLFMIPLRFQQTVCGLLLVLDKEERGGGVRQFDGADQALLDSFALQAGAALHNASLHRDLTRAYTELKAAQEKIARLEQLRALGDLAADLAHSMRHILGLVIGHADASLSLNSDPQAALRGILSSAEAGQDLIERLERVTRLGVGSLRVPAQVGALAEQAIGDAQVLLGERGAGAGRITWRRDLQSELPDTYLNTTDTKEAILNLLLNAAEAMPEGGEVRVSTRREGVDLIIAVADSGPGIADDVRERLFEPFFTTKEDLGTGLGLSIVYRIVEDHGGAVSVTSTPDKGSVFTLSLPIVHEPPEAAEDLDAPEDLGA